MSGTLREEEVPAENLRRGDKRTPKGARGTNESDEARPTRTTRRDGFKRAQDPPKGPQGRTTPLVLLASVAVKMPENTQSNKKTIHVGRSEAGESRPTCPLCDGRRLAPCP